MAQGREGFPVPLVSPLLSASSSKCILTLQERVRCFSGVRSQLHSLLRNPSLNSLRWAPAPRVRETAGQHPPRHTVAEWLEADTGRHWPMASSSQEAQQWGRDTPCQCLWMARAAKHKCTHCGDVTTCYMTKQQRSEGRSRWTGTSSNERERILRASSDPDVHWPLFMKSSLVSANSSWFLLPTAPESYLP